MPIKYTLSRLVHKLRVPHAARQPGLLLWTLAAISLLALQAPAPVAARTQTLSVESLLNPDGTLNIITGASGAVDLRGWNVTLDSRRGPILTPSNDVAPTVRTWKALPGNGLACCAVQAMAVYRNDLYVGGLFSETYDGSVTNLNNIARFSGNAWHALPHGGLNGGVSALAVFDGALFVGGTFTGTFDGARTDFNNIVRFDGKWKTVPHGGLDNTPDVFLVQEGPFISHLYMAGTFTATADGHLTGLGHVADLVQDHYNRLHWHALPNHGLNGYYVIALAKFQGDLYAGGSFTASGDNSVSGLNYIARLHGGTWEPLSGNGLSYQVYALQTFKGSLFVGGNFTSTNDNSVSNLNNIARYDGTSWHVLPGNGLNQPVRSFVVNGKDLYVGGDFNQTADAGTGNLWGVARFSGGTWSATGGGTLEPSIFALTLYNSYLYAGGNFGGPPTTNAIARLNLTVP